MFDFDELDEIERHQTMFDFDELDEQLADADSAESTSAETEADLGTEGQKELPQDDASTAVNRKIQQALADAARRRRKAEGLSQEQVEESLVNAKIQKALADARSRKGANGSDSTDRQYSLPTPLKCATEPARANCPGSVEKEVNVDAKSVSMQFEKALADAMARQQKASALSASNAPQALANTIEERVQQVVAQAQERSRELQAPWEKALASVNQQLEGSAQQPQSDFTWAVAVDNSSSALQSQCQATAWKPEEGTWDTKWDKKWDEEWGVDSDAWDRPITAGRSDISSKARQQLGKACIQANVIDEEVRRVVAEAKARRSLEHQIPEETMQQIEQAQMIAECRCQVAQKIAQQMGGKRTQELLDMCSVDSPDDAHTASVNLTMDPVERVVSADGYQQAQSPMWRSPKKTQKWVPKRIHWADEADSDGEAEGASPRQRGGG